MPIQFSGVPEYRPMGVLKAMVGRPRYRALRKASTDQQSRLQAFGCRQRLAIDEYRVRQDLEQGPSKNHKITRG
jgi:hypothetical protein